MNALHTEIFMPNLKMIMQGNPVPKKKAEKKKANERGRLPPNTQEERQF